ncbi:hypothetical protein EJB05_11827, partial [Eragrostis curvula]
MSRLEEAWEALTRTDDLVADILIRLPTLADLGRAGAAYAAFRRVVTSPLFHRRLRALHRPSLLGVHALCTGFHPVEPPHRSAAAARDLAASADFGLSFLPALGSGWMVRDVRGGRFLVDCDAGNGRAFTTVAVCDPLYRRYVLLPPIPLDLAAAVQEPHLANAERRCDVFLAPCSDEEAAAAAAVGSPEPFRVIWMAQCPTKLVAFVFSSSSGQWQAIASPSWSELNPEMPATTGMRSLFWRNYGCGSFFWLLSNFPKDCNLLVLDASTMEFSVTKSPFGSWDKEFAIVELKESKLGMFVTEVDSFHLQLFCAKWQNNGEGTYEWEWKYQSTVPLPLSFKYDMLGVFAGKLYLQARRAAGSTTRELGCFSVDFKTSKRRKVRGVLGDEFRPLSALYTGYPPSLSPPAI